MGNKSIIDEQGWQDEAKKLRRLGWIVWGIAGIAQFLNQFHRVAGSVIVDKLMVDFSISAATVGSILAVYFYVYAAMQLPTGILADYLGPRKTMTFGCLASAIGSILFGLAPSLPALYLSRFLLSLGASVIFISVLKLQTQWFHSRSFGRVSSLTGLIGRSGALVGTTPMALLVMLVGWRQSFELMGFLSLVVCLVCWLLIRDKPADKGLLSPAEIEKGKLGTRVPDTAQNADTPSLHKRLNLMLTNKYIWPPLLIGIGSYGTLLVFQGAWGIPYLMQVYSMPRDTAANFVLLMTVGFILGTLLIAFISDKLQRRKLPAIIFGVVYLFLWITMTLWNGGKPPLAALYPMCFFIGLFAGFTILIFACAKEVVPPSISGMTMGLVNFGTFLTTAVLQMAFGKVLDLSWEGTTAEGVRIYSLSGFQSGFVLVCIATTAYVIGALLLKETRCRDIYDEI